MQVGGRADDALGDLSEEGFYGGGTASNLHEFDLYGFILSGYSSSNSINTSAPQGLFTDDAVERDSQGMVVSKLERDLLVFDRAQNVAEVVDVPSGSRVGSVSLQSEIVPIPHRPGRHLPLGNGMFVSLRGPNPLSGDPDVSSGS